MAIDYDRQPFPEAVEFLSGKINVDANGWRDVWRDQHDTQFMVAGFKGTALQIIRDAIDKAIQQGSTLQEFMREGFDRAVAEGGVDYRGDRNWRAAIIYNTNLRTAYAAGRYQQMTSPDTLRRRPYWEWRHGDSRKPRPLHLALDGKVFPAGSPFWDSLFPPAGFNCKCRVFALSERDLRRMGKDAPDEPPEVGGELEATDPLTGQTTRLTVRADPGWDYVPGRSTVQQRRAAVLSKLAPQLQAQLLAEVAGSL